MAMPTLVVTKSSEIASTLSASLSKFPGLQLEHVAAHICDVAAVIQCQPGDTIVIDLDAESRNDLVALQTLMSRYGNSVNVVVLTGTFDDAVGRWFLQIRISDFIRKPLKHDDIVAVFKNFSAIGSASQGTARIVTFIPSAGGVGNTTLAVDAGVQFAGLETPSSACIVDLDFHNDACASYLDLEPRLNLDLVAKSSGHIDKQFLEAVSSVHVSGLKLFAAPADPCGENRLSAQVIIQLLDAISSNFNHVVIDIPRAWFPWTADVLRGSNEIFVVTDMTVPGLRCARRTAQKIAMLEGNETKPKVIVNRIEKQTFFGGGLRRNDVEQALDGFYSGGVANNYPLVREAIDRGVPVSMVKTGNNVSSDLRRIVFA